jgi:hypothetical protein
MTPFRVAILLSWMAVFSPTSSNAQTFVAPCAGFSIGSSAVTLIAEPWDGSLFCDSVSVSRSAVTGQPYYAVLEPDETQIMPDGTSIAVSHQSRFYRDSTGKSRYEIFAPIDRNPAQQTPDSVMLYDPSSHVRCEFLPQHPLPRVALCRSFQLIEPPPPSPPPDSQPSPNIADHVDEYVSKLRTDSAKYIKTSTEDLGTQMMEEVPVVGERATWTLPSWSTGDRPTVIVEEAWTSTDFEFPILSRRSDSHGDVTVTRLVSLDRSEPDPALLQVPSDCTVHFQ